MTRRRRSSFRVDLSTAWYVALYMLNVAPDNADAPYATTKSSHIRDMQWSAPTILIKQIVHDGHTLANPNIAVDEEGQPAVHIGRVVLSESP